MICRSCGANIVNEALTVCPYCGKPVGGRAGEPPVYATTWQGNGANAAGGSYDPGRGAAGPNRNFDGYNAGPGRYADGYQAGPGRYAGGNPVYTGGNNGARGKMIASMVLGILSLIIAWFGWGALVSIILAIIGLCLGVSGKKSAPAGMPTGMAVAGIVCSVIGFFLSSIVFVSCVLCAAAAGTAGLFSY